MTENNIEKVAVVGAGTMGPGMAATFARNGFDTALFDVKPDQLEKASGTVDFVYATLTGGGFMSAEDADAGRARITSTTDLAAALDRADFVVETVPEQKALKQQVFKDLEAHVGDEVILGSNTSGIPISELASVTRVPSRVVGMHWSNPPHLIPVIEVIRGERTSWSRRSAWCRRSSIATSRGSSRTASSTPLCARHCTFSTREWPAPRRSIRSRSGASATSWPSSGRWSSSTWRDSTFTPASPTTSTRHSMPRRR